MQSTASPRCPTRKPHSQPGTATATHVILRPGPQPATFRGGGIRLDPQQYCGMLTAPQWAGEPSTSASQTD